MPPQKQDQGEILTSWKFTREIVHEVLELVLSEVWPLARPPRRFFSFFFDSLAIGPAPSSLPRDSIVNPPPQPS